MLIGMSLLALFFTVRATYSEHYRYATFKNGVTITTAALESAWQGKKCTRGSCVDRFYVTYSFVIDGFPGVTYFHVGQNFINGRTKYIRERDEAATDIPRHEWGASRKTGKVAVSYSPSNPWANDPYGQRKQHDPTATWGLLSLCFLGLFGFGVFSLYKYRKSRLQI